MATLYPETLKPNDVPSRAERRLHDKFAELDDKYTVFHSPEWIVAGRNSDQPLTGETDFVIAHPEHGVLVLEVKGGTVEFDPAAGEWRSRGRDGMFSISDPFRQARKSRYALKEILGRASGGRTTTHVGEAVAFPDCSMSSSEVPAVYPPDVVLDHAVLEDPQSALEKVFAYWAKSNHGASLGPSGVSRLVRALAQPRVIKAPLGYELADADQKLIELTETQYRLLSALAGNTRVAIKGAAGTGKTLLAIEQSKRLAAQGHQVLLTCFNKGLADHVRANLEDEPQITVRHFHQLCREWASAAGFDPRLKPGEKSEEHYAERLPALLMDAAAALDRRFGAVVIDEAQDFDPGWVTALELLLDDIDRGVIYMLGDDNQAIFGRRMTIPSNFAMYSLTENCRNTQRIHDALSTCFPGQAVTALGPPGIDIEVVGWKSEHEFSQVLSRTLHRWAVEEKVAPRDIVVLTGRRPERSLVAKVAGGLARFRLCQHPSKADDIRLESVHAFKGLESPVVILCELEEIWSETRRELWYTALSRARVHVVILAKDLDDKEGASIGDVLSDLAILAGTS